MIWKCVISFKNNQRSYLMKNNPGIEDLGKEAMRKKMEMG